MSVVDLHAGVALLAVLGPGRAIDVADGAVGESEGMRLLAEHATHDQVVLEELAVPRLVGVLLLVGHKARVNCCCLEAEVESGDKNKCEYECGPPVVSSGCLTLFFK